MINLLSAVIAVEYMDYGFQKKFCGWKRWGAFSVGCIIYFLTVTALNRLAAFEGALGFLYGAVLIGYAIWALQGKIQDFLLAGILWVLIAIIGTYAIFGVMGLFTGESLGEMLQMDGGLRLYASMVALIVNTDEDLVCICTTNIWAGRKTRVHQTAGKTPAIFIFSMMREH